MNQIPPPQLGPVPPPVSGPSVQPPPAYVGYARGTQVHGSPELLEALADCYFGLNWVFLFNVVWMIVAVGVAVAMSNEFSGTFLLVALVLALPAIGGVAYRPLSKLACGMRWTISPVVLAILFPIALIPMGIFAYIVPQVIASTEIGKYGIKSSFLGGFRRKQIKEVADAMRNSSPYQAQMQAEMDQRLY